MDIISQVNTAMQTILTTVADAAARTTGCGEITLMADETIHE